MNREAKDRRIADEWLDLPPLPLDDEDEEEPEDDDREARLDNEHI